MSRPGDLLRALASHVFDAETMEHVIDPVVADLQLEYGEASRTRGTWRRRRARLAGYVAFARVTTRTLRTFLALTFATTLLLELPALARYGTKFVLYGLLFLAPQALVVAIPVALTLATAWAGRSASPSHRSAAVTIVAGAVCSLLSFVLLASFVPRANQAFRVAAAREAGMTYRPPPGPPELTMDALRQQREWAASGHMDWVHVDPRELEFTYYFRSAFACASLSLALLLLAVVQRGFRRRFVQLTSIPILFGYCVLTYFGRGYALHSVWPSMAAAWMPNVVTLAVAAAIAVGPARRQVVA